MPKGFGLEPLQEDSRDFDVGAVVTLPEKYPDELYLDIPPDWIREQVDDLCAGYASSLASSHQEDVLLEPLFTWIMAREIRGVDPDHWGIDLRSMAKAHGKVGALEKAPYTIEDKPEKYRNTANWPVIELLKRSVRHKKKSFVFIRPTQGMDMFDTLKAAFSKYKTPVFLGLRWPYGDTAFIDTYKEGGYGHAVAMVGYDNISIKVANSWGTDSGDDGFHYLSREVINNDPRYYGAVFFTDHTKEELKYHIQNGIKLDEPIIKNLLIASYRAVLGLLKHLVRLKRDKLEEKQEVAYTATNSKYLLPALVWQESNGLGEAVGDRDLLQKAYGHLQIRQPVCNDVNHIHGTMYQAKWCLGEFELSRMLFNEYMRYWATEDRLGRSVKDQDRARIWNGGPTGYKRESTLPYWWSVKKKMRQLENGDVPAVVANRLARLGIYKFEK